MKKAGSASTSTPKSTTISTTMDIRQKNRRELLSLLIKTQPATRNDLRQKTGFSYTTIGNLLNDLSESGLIRQSGEADSTGGRKARLIELDNSNILFLVIDLTGMNYKWGVYSLNHQNLVQETCRIPDKTPPVPALKLFFEDIQNRCLQENLFSRIVHIGVVLPGYYNEETDRTENTPDNVMDDIPLGALIQQTFNRPWIIQNDARTAAMQEIEAMENSEGKQLFYLLILKNSIGSAFILNNTPYTGANKYTGELFMMPVYNGEKEFSLGEILSPVTDIKSLEQAEVQNISDQEFFELFKSGNSIALEIYQKNMVSLAKVILNIICVINPSDIVIGGFYNGYGTQLLTDIKAKISHLGEEWQAESLNLRFDMTSTYSMLDTLSLQTVSHWISQQ